eukprot:TRINITY_DN3061_c0_g1_i1.p1 TRINITY_DN3061_c0_g1~~TRINITY_DN3061_c0_g1_i1.p1  ORF type:complete len:324 (-),score=70.74 TRINITY_DN3061_c0_g1_i1:74-1045(-)
MRAIFCSLSFFCFIVLSTSIRIPQHLRVSDEDLFHNHILFYRLDFSPEEKEARFKIFQENLQFIRSFQGDGFRVGMNKFAHLSKEEFKAKYLSKSLPTVKQSTGVRSNLCPATLPQSVDYRDKIFPVVDQGELGNAAAITSVSAIKDGIFVRNGVEVPALSLQNLIDCVSLPSPPYYYDWIVKNNGIDTAASYPPAGQPESCKFNPATVGARISWYQPVKDGNETDLACALAGVGPTTVCVDASHDSFQFYDGGVYYEPSCTTNVDHCMEAVGYGSTAGRDFWIVKNSWGTGWGLHGFVLMARNKNNNCGISSFAFVPNGVPV